MNFDLYDFDGTIYDGDSGVDLVFFAFKKCPKQLLRIPKICIYAFLYLIHVIDKVKMKSLLFSFVEYIGDIDSFVEDFWSIHEKKLKEFWLNKKDHSKDIIISASGTFWLNYIKDKYKVYDLFATEYDLKTGKIIGLNCHGKEKVNVFYKRYPKGKIMTMYTDSMHDLPLLKEAKKGFLVKKNVITEFKEK